MNHPKHTERRIMEALLCALLANANSGGRLHIHSHPLQLPLVFQAVADVAVNGNNLLSHRKTGWFRVEFRLEPSNWASAVVDRAFRNNLIQELISHVPIFINPQLPCIPPKSLVE